LHRLTNVAVPNCVITLGVQAFYGCTALTNVTIGNRIANIGNYAFFYCPVLKAASFLGNAPSLGYDVFDVNNNVTVYYLPGTTGWGSMLGTARTAPWVLPYPLILTTAPGFGFQSNVFGFIISWATNVPVVVEASTGLANPVWSSASTNNLTSGWSVFSDAGWTNSPTRFYRVRPL
jgi:hypothetical protein